MIGRLLLLLCTALPLLLLTMGLPGDWDDTRLQPFVMRHREGASSLADVSFLLEAPAGKDGFVRVRGGHLVTADGKRLRLWGVHLTDWSRGSVMLPPKEEAPVWAGTLARFGINCVRLHFLDLVAPRGIIDGSRDDSRAFDAQQLDRLDFLVAELKKRGIYVDLNLNVGRSYKAGDGVRDYDRIRWGKGLVLFDPRLIELQKEYARQLLTHFNPYTRTEYRLEPAVAIVEILNENGLYQGFRAPTPYYDQQLTDLYNAWINEKLSPEQRQRLRAMAGVAGDAPVPRLQGPQVAAAPRERFATEMAFFMETEARFYEEMAGYLKQTLGVKAPIIASNDHAHAGSSYPMLAAHSQMEIVDGHAYWQHPGAPVTNTPMVNDPLHSTVVRLSRTAFAGKPFTVSEINHPFPSDWASEGIPILAAYGSFQDWDAIFMYTFEPKQAPDWQPHVGDPFDIALDPVKMTQMATGALTFLRADVRPARQTVTRSYTREQVIDSRRLPGAEQPYFTPGFPLATPQRHGSRIRSLEGPPTETWTAAEDAPLVADTNELTWSTSAGRNGLVTVETDRTQALIGFLRANPKALRNLAADVTTPFGSIVLASMDGRPLSQSSKMLLTAGSRVANTGMQWNNTRTRVENWGGPPTLIEPVTGTITLRNLRGATAVTATALDGAGRPLEAAIAARKSADGWILRIGEPATTWYVVAVQRR